MTIAYHRVAPSRWHLLRPLPDRERLLDLYVRTCEHRSTEGLFYLPVDYVRADLGWTTHVIRRAFEGLQAAELVLVDFHASVVLLPDALVDQAPKSAAQINHALRRLRIVPKTTLWTPFVDLATTHAKGFAEALQTAPQSEIPALPDGESKEPASRARTRSSSSSSKETATSTGGGRRNGARDARAETQPQRSAGRHRLNQMKAIGGRS